ncbi:MAG: hypothetical protein HQ559_15215 [Lentisphaerae bacterium]|nr:hypothetical protein [Lentisphaerota bacterium]
MQRKRAFELAAATILVLATWLAVPIASAGVREGYKRPTLTIPYAASKPTIDGAVNDAEWQGATSVRALQTTKQEVSVRQTRFFFMWDEDNLYLAMRSPLRHGELLIQKLRDRQRDVNVVFDDSYEVWIDAGSIDPKTGLKCFYQFLSNFAGTRFDTVHLPSVGNSRLGWTSGWEPANRVVQTAEGAAWEWELVIPRDSIGKDQPFRDGDAVSCLVARNYKRPWEQNSFEGIGAFSVVDSYTRLTLSKRAPGIHLLGVADKDGATLGLRLAGWSATDSTIGWSFQSDSGVTKKGTTKLKSAAKVMAVDAMDLDELSQDADGNIKGDGDYRVTVTGGDGKTVLLDWCAKRAFGTHQDMAEQLSDSNMRIDLRAKFSPAHNYVRVVGDFVDYAAREMIETVTVMVRDATKKVLKQRDLAIDDDAYVKGVFQLGDIPYGTYGVKMVCRDDAGGEIETVFASFTKRDHAKEFPWWNTPHGNIERVIPPWTPVTFDANTFGVWGRRMGLGVAGLPARITTQGRDVLAGPARVEAEMGDGKVVVAKARKRKADVLSRAGHRVTTTSTARLATLDIETKTTVEFDGMYKVTMRIDPKRPTALGSLKVVVPLTKEVSDYVHAAGEGIRTGFYYGFLPKDKGKTVWTSKAVDSQPMAVGSFIPYVWIGNTKGGVCWFADSDEGWVPNNDVPAIEVVRQADGSANLVLNLISSDFTLDQPRTVTFAFQASPVKRMHKGWRMDTWWCGDTFKNYSFVGHLIWNAVPFTKNPAECKKMVDATHARGSMKYIFGFEDEKYRPNAVPYFIHQNLPEDLVPEMKYFGEDWRTSISECLYYGKTLTDYMVHHYAEWCKATGIDGYYVDNMRPVACDNIEAGRGYRLPDGRIQPTYQMFSTRRYFLRMRAAFAENGKTGKMVLHMTNNMIIPWVGAADMAYDGEHHVIYPEMNKDFMDFWPLDRMRVDFSAQWGTAVNFMQEYQGEFTPKRLAKVMRSFTGMVILHDALPLGNCNGWNQPVWIGKHRFGIDEDDVEFVGYWKEGSGIGCEAKDVKLAVWRRPGKILVAVVNMGEKVSAKVSIDAAKLGLGSPANWQVSDAEAETTCMIYGGKEQKNVMSWDSKNEGPIVHNAKGVLTVPVNRHDYRQVIVTTVNP